MSKMEVLNSYLTERLSAAVREILEAVEATVTEYRKESEQTRIENHELREQLRDALGRAEAAERATAEAAHSAFKSVSEEISPCEPQTWNLCLEKQEELQEELQEEQKDQNQDGEWSNSLVTNEEKPHTLETAYTCKTEGDSLKEGSRAESLTSAAAQEHQSEQDLDVSLPAVKLHRVKVEPEETEIPVTLLDTDDPLHLVHSFSPETSQRTRCHNASLSDAHMAEIEEHIMAHPVPSSGVSENITNKVQGNAPYKCPHCMNTFNDLKTLQIHQQAHEQAFGCTWCNKGFYNSSDLQRHMRTHTGERPFSCTWCSKGFFKTADLRRHLRTHTGERPYRCTWCSKSFTQRGNLWRHMRIHTREKTYQGSYWSRSFSDGQTLKKHQRKHF